MMIKALTTNEERSWNHWVKRNGGDKTLYSYGFVEEDIAVNEKDFKTDFTLSCIRGTYKVYSRIRSLH